MNGWIKLHRRIIEWEWYDDPITKSVFIHLLLLANHEEKQWRGVTIKRGQVITGRKKLADELGLTERKIRTALKRLKSTNEVTIKTTNNYSLITIIKYDDYQNNEPKNDQQSDQQVDQQVTSKRPASDHKQELKNYKNEKNNIKVQIPKEFDCDEFRNTWAEFKAHRRRIRKPMTDYAQKLMLKKLYVLANGKREIAIAILEQSIERGWQGVFDLIDRKDKNQEEEIIIVKVYEKGKEARMPLRKSAVKKMVEEGKIKKLEGNEYVIYRD